MARQSFSKSVLESVLAVAARYNGEATVDNIFYAMDFRSYRDRKRLTATLSDLCQAGRIRRISQGVYGPPPAQPTQPEKRDVMWRVLRMRRRVSIDDLVELAEVSKDYARDWLQVLVRRGIACKHQQPGLPGTWQLLVDQVERPADEGNANRLQVLRRKKKQAAMGLLDDALKQVETLGAALAEARTAITAMEDGE